MTCIIAFAPNDDVVYLAADKRSSANNEYTDRTDKVVIYQHMLMGISGEQRLNNLMQNLPLAGLSVPKSRHDYEHFVTVDLIDRIAAHIEKNRYAVVREEHRVMPNSQIVVALPGQIFSIHWDLSVIDVGWRYWTAGSGGDYARGWFKGWYDHARDLSDKNVHKALKEAIKTAAEFDPAVSFQADSYDKTRPF